MVISVSANTLAALQDAPSKGIVARDFMWLRALNRSTDEIETIGLWTGDVPVTAPVTTPNDGAVANREFQGIAGLMQVPPMPMTMKLEVRSIKVVFSNLTPEIINAALVYYAKGQRVEIYRGLFNPSTMNLVDPAHCRFDGFVNRVVIKRGRAGNDGQVVIECQSHARTLAVGNSAKFSSEFIKRRGAHYPHIDVPASVTWGQKDMVKESHRPKKSKWID